MRSECAYINKEKHNFSLYKAILYAVTIILCCYQTWQSDRPMCHICWLTSNTVKTHNNKKWLIRH